MADDAAEGDRHEARGEGGDDGEAGVATRGRRCANHEAGEPDGALSGGESREHGFFLVHQRKLNYVKGQILLGHAKCNL